MSTARGLSELLDAGGRCLLCPILVSSSIRRLESFFRRRGSVGLSREKGRHVRDRDSACTLASVGPQEMRRVLYTCAFWSFEKKVDSVNSQLMDGCTKWIAVLFREENFNSVLDKKL